MIVDARIVASDSLEDDVEEIVEEKLEEIDREEQSSGVSRRRTLGLAGLAGLGAVGVGSQSAAAVEGHTLSQDLDCTGNSLKNVNHVYAKNPYLSLRSQGTGNGNLQLYDNKAAAPFLRASETSDESEPGPVMFNTGIRGMPDEADGPDINPGPLQIIDDASLNGNELQDIGAIGGSVTGGQRLESLAGQNITIDNGQLNAASGQVSGELQTRLDDATTRLELVSGTGNNWRVGPAEPIDGPHRNGSFGVLLETDRPMYLGESQIRADSAGQFTAALFEYDSGTSELVELIDTITIQTTGHEQTIFLDFLVEEPGQYLLTRLIPFEQGNGGDGNDSISVGPSMLYRPEDDPIELYRVQEYGNHDAESQHGVTVHGGFNPYFDFHDDITDAGGHYYYHNLEVCTTDSA